MGWLRQWADSRQRRPWHRGWHAAARPGGPPEYGPTTSFRAALIGVASGAHHSARDPKKHSARAICRSYRFSIQIAYGRRPANRPSSEVSPAARYRYVWSSLILFFRFLLFYFFSSVFFFFFCFGFLCFLTFFSYFLCYTLVLFCFFPGYLSVFLYFVPALFCQRMATIFSVPNIHF